MPALQVREFPEQLYEDLKDCAARQHRSIAQQTIVAVEEMLVRENASEGRSRACIVKRFEDEKARQDRLARRRRVFSSIEANSMNLPEDMPNAVEIVRKDREERDRQIWDVCKPTTGNGALR